MSHKIVVIGSSNVDFIMKAARLPDKGETVADATFVQAFGGKGANQAVAAARAGGDVWFVACIGDDPFAPALQEAAPRGGRPCGLRLRPPGRDHRRGAGDDRRDRRF